MKLGEAQKMIIAGIKNKTTLLKVNQSINQKESEIKAGKRMEKMELALRYVKGIKTYPAREVSPIPIPDRGSRRVVSQVKMKELIG